MRCRNGAQVASKLEDGMKRKNPDLTLIDSDRLTAKEEHFACLRASGTPQGDAYLLTIT